MSEILLYTIIMYNGYRLFFCWVLFISFKVVNFACNKRCGSCCGSCCSCCKKNNETTKKKDITIVVEDDLSKVTINGEAFTSIDKRSNTKFTDGTIVWSTKSLLPVDDTDHFNNLCTFFSISKSSFDTFEDPGSVNIIFKKNTQDKDFVLSIILGDNDETYMCYCKNGNSYNATYGLFSETKNKIVKIIKTGELTDMTKFFSSCKTMTKVVFYDINTSKVTYMNHMFYSCEVLENIDLYNFDTENVTAMTGMFANCRSLTNINILKLDTSKVTHMDSMFSYCENLTSLDLSNFNTQNVTNMHYMFNACANLKSINLSNFNTQSVTDINSMFYGCKSLEDLDLSSFDTRKVTNFDNIFSECKNLIKVNILNFDFSSVNKKYNPLSAGIFFDCNALKTVVLNDSCADMNKVLKGLSFTYNNNVWSKS